MTDHLWTNFGDTVYGDHGWDDFAAYCHLGTRTTVVTTGTDFDGVATWYMDEPAGTAHYVGDVCGAYIFGDFIHPAFGPVDRDWTHTYTHTTDMGDLLDR